MKLFENIFGKSQKEQVMNENHSVNNADLNNYPIDENLFVNSDKPESSVKPELKELTIKEFLKKDFFKAGYEDGYIGHSKEIMEHRILVIESSFRFQVNLKIDNLKKQLLTLENHKLDIQGISERLPGQIDNNINALKENITELESQIALSSLKEGLIAYPIKQYKNGFLRGTQAYQQEKLLAINTGLFN